MVHRFDENVDVEMQNETKVKLLSTDSFSPEDEDNSLLQTFKSLYFKAYAYITLHKWITFRAFVEVSILAIIFSVMYAKLSQETTESLLPNYKCSSCKDCQSYSLDKQSQIDGAYLNMILQPNNDIKNYSTMAFSAHWKSCQIPTQSTPVTLIGLPYNPTTSLDGEVSLTQKTTDYLIPFANSPSLQNDDSAEDVGTVTVNITANSATEKGNKSILTVYNDICGEWYVI